MIGVMFLYQVECFFEWSGAIKDQEGVGGSLTRWRKS
jgi:hypothetical protein